jgi:adenosylcobinamide-GDP ribazoletransferase
LVGATGGAAYWLAAELWPTSVALILSMLATVWMTRGIREAGLAVGSDGLAMLGVVFAVLTKYNALMALSAANLPFTLPPNVALGLIMIAGHATSGALVVSVMTVPGAADSHRVSAGTLSFALQTGLAPALLLGLPGLVGLAAAIFIRIAFGVYMKHRKGLDSGDGRAAAQQLTEIGFYLGALATWTYT